MFYDKVKKAWKSLGPGLITGASDDDPSGIITYSVAGARMGPHALWSMLYTLPLMTAIQEMSARIGLSSQCGLAGNIKKYYSKLTLILISDRRLNLSWLRIGTIRWLIRFCALFLSIILSTKYLSPTKFLLP